MLFRSAVVDEPPPNFRSLAETVATDGLQAYRISELLLAAYNAGVRYKTDADLDRQRRAIAQAQLADARDPLDPAQSWLHQWWREHGQELP